MFSAPSSRNKNAQTHVRVRFRNGATNNNNIPVPVPVLVRVPVSKSDGIYANSIRAGLLVWCLRVCGSHSPGAKREPTTRSATLDRQRQEAALFGVRLPGAPRIICEHVAKRTCVVCLCFYVFDPNRSHCWLLAAAVLPLVHVRCLVSAARSIGSSRSGYGNTVHTAECDHGE